MSLAMFDEVKFDRDPDQWMYPGMAGRWFYISPHPDPQYEGFLFVPEDLQHGGMAPMVWFVLMDGIQFTLINSNSKKTNFRWKKFLDEKGVLG